jgi:hypothetical protein
MAKKRWLGIVAPVSQISKLTVGGTIVIGDVFTVVCGYSTVTVTAADAVAANVAILLLAALRAGSGEFQDATWTLVGAVITGTGVPGVPFVITSSATASATLVTTNPTAATGPNFADVAGNWSGASLPIAADEVFVEAGTPPIMWGLTALTALFAKTVIESGVAQIGLPEIHPRGFREYRQQWWSINTTILENGNGGQETSGRVKIDLKATATSVFAGSTGTGDLNQAEPPLQLIGASGGTAIVENGSVAFADRVSDAAGFTSITVGPRANVKCGITCTHTTVTSFGNTTLENSVTNLNVKGGRTIAKGQVTNLDVSGIGSTCVYGSSSTITAALVGPGALASGDSRAKTITALTLRAGGSLQDPQGTFTATTLTKASDVRQINTSS